MGLLLADKATLQTSQWLNDNIINAAQQLLKQTFANMEGQMSPQLGKNMKFKRISTCSRYLQVLHVNGNHWICVSNIGLHSQEPVTDRAFIYDSFVPDNIVSNETPDMFIYTAIIKFVSFRNNEHHGTA